MIALARAKLSVDKIATKMKSRPKAVLMIAKRLGVRLAAQKVKSSPK